VTTERFRLAEPLAALSIATDLARGRPAEEAVRACLAASALAEELGFSEVERSAAYWTTLLRSIGCTATSHEYAVLLGGDDVAVRHAADAADLTVPREAFAFFAELARSAPRGARLVRGAALATRARGVAREGARADCEVGARLASRVGLDSDVESSLRDSFERWDGKGFPEGRRADGIAPAARLAAVAHAVVASADPVATVSRWSGRVLDPQMAGAFLRVHESVLATAAADDAVSAVVAADPSQLLAPAERLEDVALAFADVADLKAPFLHGHSRGVAALADAAATSLGLPEGERATVRLSALLHDLGRVAVSTGIWEKPGPLTHLEWEAVRLHPYHGERILQRSDVLAPLALTVGQHHERMNGSGYHRGASASQLARPARILAAADVLHAMCEERPYRPALPVADAARTLTSMPLDPESVAAVLDAAGQPRPRRQSYPAGLTEREVEVLRLLAVGQSKKQIAAQLVVSPSTVHTHVVHVYEKASVSTRAAAALFALEHGLLEPKID
jgi:HD-GYP domain-containing protein (c-di-GMP phosphodiesterase class II)